MDANAVFTGNLFSFARMLGAWHGGGALSGPSGSLAASSGLPYAGENYLLLKPGATVFEAERLISFFSARELPFVVPELPGTPDKLVSALETGGILPVRTYTAMIIEQSRRAGSAEPLMKLVGAGTDAADEWGRAAWMGFDGGAEVPEDYLSLARHLAGCRENALYLLEEAGRALACGLLHKAGDACGLYYFATLPEFRRRGFARRLMEGLAGEAARGGREMVLLATPEGLPFYLDFGFKRLSEITIRSASADL